MEAPVSGIALADIAEGGIVKINESRNPVEFYVAKHDYESGLNGPGRTLLARKECLAAMRWDDGNVNAYSGSDMDIELNGDYKGSLDATVQTVIGTTSFYNTPGGSGGLSAVSSFSKSVFLLSATELGLSKSDFNVEGTTLPISSALKVGYRNGVKTSQWTRSPINFVASAAVAVTVDGAYTNDSCTDANGYRPCFTLPATALFDEETLEFKGVV